MPKIRYTDHARERMFLRNISKSMIRSALDQSDKTIAEDDGDTRYVKEVRRESEHHDLHVVAKPLTDEGKDVWLIKTVWIRGEDDPVGLEKLLKTLWMKLFFR